MASEEWLAEHKGEYLYTCAAVWECDDTCGCSEAQVVDYYQNKVVRNAVVPIKVWEGDWYMEDMGDRPGSAAADLAAYRRALRESDPEREAAIRWQEGIDYEGLAA